MRGQWLWLRARWSGLHRHHPGRPWPVRRVGAEAERTHATPEERVHDWPRRHVRYAMGVVHHGPIRRARDEGPMVVHAMRRKCSWWSEWHLRSCWSWCGSWRRPWRSCGEAVVPQRWIQMSRQQWWRDNSCDTSPSVGWLEIWPWFCGDEGAVSLEGGCGLRPGVVCGRLAPTLLALALATLC